MNKNSLLKKLKTYEKEAKKSKKENINIDASFEILTDEEIALVLAHRAKRVRVQNNIKQKEFSQSANLSSPTTYSNFEQTGKVSLLNFIKIIRNFGRSKELESLLQIDISSIIDNTQQLNKSRVRDSK